jgi:uncharacterized protein (TIGR02421 family)
MPDISPLEAEKLSRAAALLLEAEDRLPVLKSLTWDRALAERFLATMEPPAPVYSAIDPAPSLQRVAEARRLIDGASPAHRWLTRFADLTVRTAALLASVGQPEFYHHSASLYGGPNEPIADGRRTALDLARRLDTLLSEFRKGAAFGALETIDAPAMKLRLEGMLDSVFGAERPRIEVTRNVSAKAAAGRDYIKLREDAMFSDLDVTQLLQHEAFVHIATGKNGQAQTRFPILAESYPGNARTQEGLAVFAEFISGALDPARFRRLADRVIAIDMAANGADFREVFGFFRDRNERDAPYEDFESARRVFRGGVISGGAPFTKDSVYLGGLLEVHNFLRAAARAGDTEYLSLLFVGKIDLSDLEAMRQLKDSGLIIGPRFMPPWVKDLRFLLSYLAYSTFLNEVNLSAVTARYEQLFE